MGTDKQFEVNVWRVDYDGDLYREDVVVDCDRDVIQDLIKELEAIDNVVYTLKGAKHDLVAVIDWLDVNRHTADYHLSNIREDVPGLADKWGKFDSIDDIFCAVEDIRDGYDSVVKAFEEAAEHNSPVIDTLERKLDELPKEEV